MSKPRQPRDANTNKVILFRDEKYQEEDFIVPAQDTKGHSERIFFRCQPGHLRELSMIINSKRFPFKTDGDIIRLALKCIIAELNRMESVPGVSQQVNAVIQLVRDEQFHQEFDECFDQIARSMQRYVNAAAKDQARRLLLKIKAQFDDMPDGFWKRKYLQELGDRYKDYLQGVDLFGKIKRDREREKARAESKDAGRPGADGGENIKDLDEEEGDDSEDTAPDGRDER